MAPCRDRLADGSQTSFCRSPIANCRLDRQSVVVKRIQHRANNCKHDVENEGSGYSLRARDSVLGSGAWPRSISLTSARSCSVRANWRACDSLPVFNMRRMVAKRSEGDCSPVFLGSVRGADDGNAGSGAFPSGDERFPIFVHADSVKVILLSESTHRFTWALVMSGITNNTTVIFMRNIHSGRR